MYNITITGKNENVIGCIDDVIAGLYSVVVYQIQQDSAITVVDGVGEESVLLGYTPLVLVLPSMTTSSPLPTGTMYCSTLYNYCYIYSRYCSTIYCYTWYINNYYYIR